MESLNINSFYKDNKQCYLYRSLNVIVYQYYYRIDIFSLAFDRLLICPTIYSKEVGFKSSFYLPKELCDSLTITLISSFMVSIILNVHRLC